MTFDSLWRRRDSTFLIEGKRNGKIVLWDTAGNIIGKAEFKDDHFIGKEEGFTADGRPFVIKHYNDSGQLHGPWLEWWPNGNKKNEILAYKNQVVEATEYYPTGKPRIKYRIKPEETHTTVLETRYIEGEAWAPDGRPAGRIVNGTGRWLTYPKDEDGKPPVVFFEAYRDSLLRDVEEFDTTRARRWVDSLEAASSGKPRR